jgi:hypothetical protein
MTTIKRNWGIICILLIAVWLLAPATTAIAKKEKFKARSVSQISKMHVIKVGDVEGHIIAVYERRGLAFFDGEVATFLNRAMYDMTKGKGTAEGYVTYTFEDGSTTISKFQGTLAPSEGKRITAEGTFIFIGGSGRFEGIKGDGKWTAKSYTPYTKEETKSDLIVDVTGTRILPKK